MASRVAEDAVGRVELTRRHNDRLTVFFGCRWRDEQIKARAAHVASSVHLRPANADALARTVERDYGWAASKVITEKALKMYERGQGPSILTTDQVK